ncbi:MAG: DUF58 domain-containing protein, partial [Luteolibacter sp.]
MKKCHQSQSTGRATDLLQRLMYHIYRRSSRVQRSIQNRLRPAGLVLGVAWLVMACLVLGHVKRSVHELFALSTAFGILALLSMASRRARLTARRELPGVASVGVPLKIPVMVRNRGSRPLRRAWLCESVPDALPSLTEFLLRREPCEDERNAFDRALAFLRWQWLVEWGRWFSGGRADDEIYLRPGEECRVWIPLTPTRRGRIELADLRVILPDAFGFFQRFTRVVAPRDPWIVLPKCYPVPQLELPGFASRPHQGLSEVAHVAMTGDFVGLRDYQPGDSLRQIHW